MIHQVIATWICPRRSAEVDSVGLACALNSLVSTRETHEPRVEFRDVDGSSEERVACRVASDKDGVDHRSVLAVDAVHYVCHLVELLGTDVGAVCETEIDEAEASLEILLRHFSTLHVGLCFVGARLDWGRHHQLKVASDLGPPHSGLVRLGTLTFLDNCLFVFEINEETNTGHDKEGSGASIEWLLYLHRKEEVSVVAMRGRKKKRRYLRRLLHGLSLFHHDDSLPEAPAADLMSAVGLSLLMTKVEMMRMSVEEEVAGSTSSRKAFAGARSALVRDQRRQPIFADAAKQQVLALSVMPSFAFVLGFPNQTALGRNRISCKEISAKKYYWVASSWLT